MAVFDVAHAMDGRMRMCHNAAPPPVHCHKSRPLLGCFEASAGYRRRALTLTTGRSLAGHTQLSRRRGCKAVSAVSAAKSTAAKEAHLIFDEVFINVKSGDGGNGEVVAAGKGRTVDNFKYKSGGNSPKRIFLIHSDPAEGADGASVVLVCDSSCPDLLHLHSRTQYTAPRGGNANPAVGSDGPKKNRAIKKAFTPPLEIPVPPGTVVKRKSNGVLLGELIVPGQRLVVAQGGRGGDGVVAASPEKVKLKALQAERAALAQGVEVVSVPDHNWKQDAQGLPGQQLGLHLLLRVVADIGIVGLPNAGKSSLLAALTRAAPEIAAYPFTTLMPNLGVMAAGSEEDGYAAGSRSASRKPVLADLPGLIEGAHQGKGLGRMFLRHLRRTNALLHVIDASAADPAADYEVVREELRMYNPEYCARPHVVALNKMDLDDANTLRQELMSDILATAKRLQSDWHDRQEEKRLAPPERPAGQKSKGRGGGGDKMEDPEPVLPTLMLACSAVSGEGIPELSSALEQVLGRSGASAAPRVVSAAQAAAAKAPDTAHAWLLELSDDQLLELEKRGGKRAGWRTPPAATAGAPLAAAGRGLDADLQAEWQRRRGQTEREEAEVEGAGGKGGGDAVAGSSSGQGTGVTGQDGVEEDGSGQDEAEDVDGSLAAELAELARDEADIAASEAAWLLELDDEHLAALEAAVREDEDEENDDFRMDLLQRSPEEVDADERMLNLSDEELMSLTEDAGAQFSDFGDDGGDQRRGQRAESSQGHHAESHAEAHSMSRPSTSDDVTPSGAIDSGISVGYQADELVGEADGSDYVGEGEDVEMAASEDLSDFDVHLLGLSDEDLLNMIND